MAHRVNIMLDEVAWSVLEQFPKGERSKVVNMAITEWERSRRRPSAVQRMDALGVALPEISTAEIVEELRKDREYTK